MHDDKPLNHPDVVAAYEQLQAVNHDINNRNECRDDIALYNKPDFWEIAAGQGDCEDFALAKQRALMQAGWPMRDVRLAGCGNPGGPENHCVLLARLAGGDYVLDNLIRQVLPWRQTGYQFHRIQMPGKFFWQKVKAA